jgi:hypothetical protein
MDGWEKRPYTFCRFVTKTITNPIIKPAIEPISKGSNRLIGAASAWVGAAIVAAAIVAAAAAGGTGTGCGCGCGCAAISPGAAGVVDTGACMARGARTGWGWLLTAVGELLIANPLVTIKNKNNPTNPMLTNRCRVIIRSPYVLN